MQRLCHPVQCTKLTGKEGKRMVTAGHLMQKPLFPTPRETPVFPPGHSPESMIITANRILVQQCGAQHRLKVLETPWKANQLSNEEGVREGGNTAEYSSSHCSLQGSCLPGSAHWKNKRKIQKPGSIGKGACEEKMAALLEDTSSLTR